MPYTKIVIFKELYIKLTFAKGKTTIVENKKECMWKTD